ncbi:MAG: ISAs1 family transposase [Tannerella sp.]|nr:ISAs1 family transposase [Tannerella sp.]
MNALTDNEARWQMRFSIDRNALTGNAQNDTAHSIKAINFADYSRIILVWIMEKVLSAYFSEVEDPRVEGRCLHLLSDILMIAVLTYLTGGTDYQGIYLFAKRRGKSFLDLLKLPNGVSCVDTFEHVFGKLKSESLQSCLERYEKELLSCLSEKQVVLDGKKLKGVSPHGRGNSGLYIPNARVSENRIRIGQEKVEEKSNEITAIPQLLSSPDIEEAVVSIDAMGTQTAIAEQIIAQVITFYRLKATGRDFSRIRSMLSKQIREYRSRKRRTVIMAVSKNVNAIFCRQRISCRRKTGRHGKTCQP